MTENFFGKYRGVVTNIEDPNKIGRIRATVPDVLGHDESGWAMPCAPFAGQGMGFFALPKVGTGVWIEFEHGDPEYPIWSGCWWGSASEMPSDLSDSPYKKVLIKTAGGHSILLDDTEGNGGITIQTSNGQKIVMNADGIEINNGIAATVKLSGPKVSINDDALEVI